jgi:hypothetical protein
MFDVFEILIPELSTNARLEIRQKQTAFGSSDDRFVYVDGTRFARIVMAREAYSNVEVTAGSAGRVNWTLLLAAATANEAAMNDETWARFLAALALILATHAFWRVTCESDCEQHPIERLALSADRLSQLLDSHRSTGFQHIAIQVSAGGTAKRL